MASSQAITQMKENTSGQNSELAAGCNPRLEQGSVNLASAMEEPWLGIVAQDLRVLQVDLDNLTSVDLKAKTMVCEGVVYKVDAQTVAKALGLPSSGKTPAETVTEAKEELKWFFPGHSPNGLILRTCTDRGLHKHVKRMHIRTFGPLARSMVSWKLASAAYVELRKGEFVNWSQEVSDMILADLGRWKQGKDLVHVEILTDFIKFHKTIKVLTEHYRSSGPAKQENLIQSLSEHLKGALVQTSKLTSRLITRGDAFVRLWTEYDVLKRGMEASQDRGTQSVVEMEGEHASYQEQQEQQQARKEAGRKQVNEDRSQIQHAPKNKITFPGGVVGRTEDQFSPPQPARLEQDLALGLFAAREKQGHAVITFGGTSGSERGQPQLQTREGNVYKVEPIRDPGVSPETTTSASGRLVMDKTVEEEGEQWDGLTQSQQQEQVLRSSTEDTPAGVFERRALEVEKRDFQIQELEDEALAGKDLQAAKDRWFKDREALQRQLLMGVRLFTFVDEKGAAAQEQSPALGIEELKEENQRLKTALMQLGAEIHIFKQVKESEVELKSREISKLQELLKEKRRTIEYLSDELAKNPTENRKLQQSEMEQQSFFKNVVKKKKKRKKSAALRQTQDREIDEAQQAIMGSLNKKGKVL